jgi:MOSC domain-containing protein YiiM
MDSSCPFPFSFCPAPGRIKAISISAQKGVAKSNVPQAELKADYGVVGDAHAGGPRQVSLLAFESIDRFREKGLQVAPGDFAENLTVEGMDLSRLAVGSRLRVARASSWHRHPADAAWAGCPCHGSPQSGVELEVTQLGKKCHGRCRIYEKVGDCIMPVQGVFARVVVGGTIRVGDIIEALDG